MSKHQRVRQGAVSSHRLDAILHWPSVDARGWAEWLVASACREAGVDAVVTHGSAVRPSVHAGSDVDLLVIYHGARPSCLTTAHSEVDVQAYERDVVEDLLAKGHGLLVSALSSGVLVCERDDYWSGLVERWREKLPFPSMHKANQDAERAEHLALVLTEMGDTDAASEQALAALTLRARARLIESGGFPLSRPELPAQLRAIHADELADALEQSVSGAQDPTTFLRPSRSVGSQAARADIRSASRQRG
jgi:predicted nucleotidyltransferase